MRERGREGGREGGRGAGGREKNEGRKRKNEANSSDTRQWAKEKGRAVQEEWKVKAGEDEETFREDETEGEQEPRRLHRD